MTRPKSRAELLYAVEEEFAKLCDVVSDVPINQRDVPGACEDWSVKDLLAHLDAWHELFLRWETVGSTGEMPAMPAHGYNWSQVPQLNHEIYERHRHDDWDVVENHLKRSYAMVLEVIMSHTDEDLFTKKRFAWTGSTSIGSYATSASSSHYAWARKLITKFLKDSA